MEPSFFLKCEKCDSKPATIRLTNGVQEKKICFQCERDLTKEPFYKEWTKQFIPYSELKGSNAAANKAEHSRQFSATKQDKLLRSPPQTTPNTNRNYSQSIARDRSNRPTENLILKSPSGQLDSLRRSSYNLETVSPRVGIGKRSYDISKLQIETENRPSSGVIRHNAAQQAGTPSRFGFFSEYMKDFNPKSTDFKSPTGRAVKKNILEKTTRTYSSSSFLSPTAVSGFESVKHEREQRERNTANPEHYKTTPLTESIELSSTTGRHEKLNVNTRLRDRNYDSVDLRHVDTRQEARQEARHDTRAETRPDSRADTRNDTKLISDTLEKKTRDLRKDEIRNRMSKLSEQFYSPKRSPPKTSDDSKPFVTQESSITEYRERRHFKSAAQDVVNRSSFKNQITEAEILGAMRTEPAEDARQKFALQNYENDVTNLKAHIENLEKRHAETVRQLREELKNVREELLRERTENSSGYNKDTASLKSKIDELERRLHEESGKNKVWEEKLDQNKGSLEKRLSDTKEELERTRREKDRRIEELNNQIRTLNKSNRDTVDQMQKDNEGFINKLKNEYELTIRDLNRQLENREKEIERARDEKEDAVRNLNGKLSTLQESVKHYQEINSKLKHTLELRNEEDNMINQRLTGTIRSRNSEKSERGTFNRE